MMYNCEKIGIAQFSIRGSQPLTSHQQRSERGDILDQLSDVHDWIDERVYCTIKRICQEVLDEQREKGYKEQYLVFDGDKGMKERLYKYELQLCPNSTRGKGRNVFALNQVGSLKCWSCDPCTCSRSKSINDDKWRLPNRERGGYNADSVVKKKDKGKGKSKFSKFDDGDCKTKKSKWKSRKIEADEESSANGLKEKLTKHKKGRACESDSEFDRHENKKLKGIDCRFNEEKIKNRGRDKFSCKIADVHDESKNCAAKKGNKKCTEQLIENNSSTDLETKQRKIDKVIEKRGAFSTAKRSEARSNEKGVKAGKEVLMSKDTEKWTSEENEKKIRGQRNRRFKCKDKTANSSDEDRNSQRGKEKLQSTSAAKECKSTYRQEGKEEKKAAREDTERLKEISHNIRQTQKYLTHFQKQAFQRLLSLID